MHLGINDPRQYIAAGRIDDLDVNVLGGEGAVNLFDSPIF